MESESVNARRGGAGGEWSGGFLGGGLTGERGVWSGRWKIQRDSVAFVSLQGERTKSESGESLK